MEDNLNRGTETAEVEPATGCDHEWAVFSTALTEGWLMLQCVRCYLHGTIDEPSSDEWSAAFYASSRPYRWIDSERVTIRGSGPICVIPKSPEAGCDCIREKFVREPEAYERVADGILKPQAGLGPIEREELASLAELAVKGGMCSYVLPKFAEGMSQDAGIELTAAVRCLVDRIDQWDRKGLHMSPGVIALILRKWSQDESESTI